MRHRAFPRRNFLRWIAVALVLVGLGWGGWEVEQYRRYRVLVEELARLAR